MRTDFCGHRSYSSIDRQALTLVIPLVLYMCTAQTIAVDFSNDNTLRSLNDSMITT